MKSGITLYYRKVKMDLEGGPKLNRRVNKDTVESRRSKLRAAQQWFHRRRAGAQEEAGSCKSSRAKTRKEGHCGYWRWTQDK